MVRFGARSMTTIRRLGVDLGSRRIGLSVSEEGDLALAHRTLELRPGAKAGTELLRIAREQEAAEIILGLPRSLDGGEGPAAARVRRVAAELEAAGCRVVLWDERFTSAQAERQLIESGVRRERRRELIDQQAAVLILQSYLDSLRGTTGHGPIT